MRADGNSVTSHCSRLRTPEPTNQVPQERPQGVSLQVIILVSEEPYVVFWTQGVFMEPEREKKGGRN